MSAHNFIEYITFKTKNNRTRHEEGPAWSLMNFSHAWASAAIDSAQ